jgi:hypothetical protein
VTPMPSNAGVVCRLVGCPFRRDAAELSKLRMVGGVKAELAPQGWPKGSGRPGWSGGGRLDMGFPPTGLESSVHAGQIVRDQLLGGPPHG